MKKRSRIRMSIGWVYPIGILTSYLLVLVEWYSRSYLIRQGADISYFPFITYILVALLFIVLGIIQWFRYRNWRYPVLGIIVGLTTITGSMAMSSHDLFFRIAYFIGFISLVFFVVINWNVLYSHERYEINSRRLFRLAAERIYKIGDGFTERPYSAGRLTCTREEVLGLSRFLEGRYIAMPFYFDDNTCFAFSMNKSLMVINDPSEVSHVKIDMNGNITVRVSEKDYRDYRERLSFDELCSSIADVFTRFLDYYKKGLESRIVTELKSARQK